MAHILIVDDNTVAIKALSGILFRGEHQVAAVSSPAEAISFLEKNLMTDLVFLELDLKEAKGTLFLEERGGVIKDIPVVVYTKGADKKTVRHILEIGVQNFLMKPYSDKLVFEEVGKGVKAMWRRIALEDPDTLCSQMGYNRSSFNKIQIRLLNNLKASIQKMALAVRNERPMQILPIIEELKGDAEEIGFWGLCDLLETLQLYVNEERMGRVEISIKRILVAYRLLMLKVHPEKKEEFFESNVSAEPELTEDDKEKQRWLGVHALDNGALTDLDNFQKKINAMEGVPVIGSVAASYQMIATSKVLNVERLDDLVEADPALAIMVLRGANRVHQIDTDDGNPIEDPQMAIQLLGASRIRSLGEHIETMPSERLAYENVSWLSFWLQQNAMVYVADLICQKMELERLLPTVKYAALLSDIGKMYICHFYPYGWRASLRCSRTEKISLLEAQKRYFDCDYTQIGMYVAQNSRLSHTLIESIAYQHNPEEAPHFSTMAAVVGLAKFICNKYQVGNTGELPLALNARIDETPQWEVLKSVVFPGFKLLAFESRLEKFCSKLRSKLSGKLH